MNKRPPDVRAPYDPAKAARDRNKQHSEPPAPVRKPIQIRGYRSGLRPLSPKSAAEDVGE